MRNLNAIDAGGLLQATLNPSTAKRVMAVASRGGPFDVSGYCATSLQTIWYLTDISSGFATCCVGSAISVSPTESLSGGEISPESRV